MRYGFFCHPDVSGLCCTQLWHRGLRVLFIAAVILVGIAGSLFGRTVTVSLDGSGDYTTIQAGIDWAVEGDDVVVGDGVYTGEGNRDIDLGLKSITVRSANGAENCIIDCEGLGRGFKFQGEGGPDFAIDGFTITRGIGLGDIYRNGNWYSNGGAIHLSLDREYYDTTCTIKNCVFEGNYAARGGAIYSALNNTIIDDCVFRNNSCELGGAIFGYKSDVEIRRCMIDGNIAETSGGGLYFWHRVVRISDTRICNNISLNLAGGIDAAIYEDSFMRNCEIEDNLAGGDGGGVFLWASIPIENCRIAGNEAGERGGGIFLEGGRSEFEDCNIIENKAGNDGGGIYIKDGKAAMNRCFVLDNECGHRGGGIYSDYESGEDYGFQIFDSVVAGNRCVEDGGGIYGWSHESSTISRCTIVNNVSEKKWGAFYIQCPKYGPWQEYYSLVIENCIIWGNRDNWYDRRAAIINESGVSKLDLRFCDVEGGEDGIYILDPDYVWDSTNINSDPMMGEIDDANDFLIPNNSPCVNAGDPEFEFESDSRDVYGAGRVVLGRLDIGASECQYEGAFIEIDKQNFEFHTRTEEGNPEDQFLLISNPGNTSLNWNLSEDIEWIELDKTSGVIDDGEARIFLSVDIEKALPGISFGELILSSADSPNSPQAITVKLVLNTTFDVPGDFETIQSAIDASIDEDIIVVQDGTYWGWGNAVIDFMGKAITVRSANGPEGCIIDCQSYCRGLTFQSGEDERSIVDGFTITGGYHEQGGGIYCEDSSPTVRNCRVSGNYALDCGGGIYSVGSSPMIVSCVISKNSAENSGGGIYVDNPEYGFSRIVGCEISKNGVSGDGGGVCVVGVGGSEIRDCFVSCNYGSNGGGILLKGGNGQIINSVILGNTAQVSGGAISVCEVSGAAVWNCTIVNNIAWGDCGGVFIGDNDSVAFLYNSILSGNVRGALVSPQYCFVVWNCLFYGNPEGDVFETDAGVLYTGAEAINSLYFASANIDGDPMFVELPDDGGDGWVDEPWSDWYDESANNVYGDLHLEPGSEAIDSGINTVPSNHNVILPVVENDLDGNNRIQDGNIDGIDVVDIGVYELPPQAPFMKVDKAEVVFYATEEIDCRVEQTIEISNYGIGRLHWEIQVDMPWVMLSLESGFCGSDPNVLRIVVDKHGMALGKHCATINLVNRENVENQYFIDVSFYLFEKSVVIVDEDWGSTQDAIDASVSGDVIVIAPGSYDGPISFGGRNIVLQSLDPERGSIVEETVITGFGANSVITFSGSEDPNCVLAGLTITGGRGQYGGGICGNESECSIEYCRVVENNADVAGGGVYACNGRISNCEISDNVSEGAGGGLGSCQGVIENCSITNNKARGGQSGGGMAGSSGVIRDCLIAHNYSDSYGGGAAYCYGEFIGCEIRNNHARLDGGGVADSIGPIVNCTISDNYALRNGGGVYCPSGGIRDSVISDNRCVNWGSAFYSNGGTFSNCLITGNKGSHVILHRGKDFFGLVNCTIADNHGESKAIAIYQTYSWYPPLIADITNCIIRNGGEEIIAGSDTNLTVSFCNVEGGWEGVGNIDADPLFETLHSAAYLDDNGTPGDYVDDFLVEEIEGDYHLRSLAGRWDGGFGGWVFDDVTSGCIDAGSPGFGLGGEFDEVSNVRINMGAYGGTAEASRTPDGWGILCDMSNDKVVDFGDFGLFAGEWGYQMTEGGGLRTDGAPWRGDLDRDGVVGIGDLVLFAEEWGLD